RRGANDSGRRTVANCRRRQLGPGTGAGDAADRAADREGSERRTGFGNDDALGAHRPAGRILRKDGGAGIGVDADGEFTRRGGAQAYKGFGLGLMIEILTGALSGGNCAKTVPYPKKGNCVFMLLIDPAKFGGTDCFQSEVHQLVDYVRSCPRVEGVSEIVLPG